MGIQLVTYRETYFPSEPDMYTWRQLYKVFGVKPIMFLDGRDIELDPSTLVIFDETGEIPLKEFNHPENAFYLFGSAGMTGIQKDYPKEVTSVRIEVPNLITNQGLFGCQAAAIVLYDREMKKWD